MKKVEILYFDGCPTYLEAEKTLREILEEQGEDAEVKLVAVNTDGEAQALRFTGSPTIRVDGEDLFPVPERAEYALGCRVYATSEGLRGSPTATMLSEALTKKAEVPKEAFRDDVRRMIEEGARIVDVLPCEEYEEAYLRGAINIPIKELNRETTAGLDRDTPVIVYCHDYL